MNAPYNAVGDGVHDDSLAVQAANDAGDVCFPSGHTFLLNTDTREGLGLLSISQNNRHWQSGMIGGPRAILKNTNDTSGRFLGIGSSGGSFIGLDVHFSHAGGPPFYSFTTEFDEITIWGNSGGGFWTFAGSNFDGNPGDAPILDYSSTCGPGHDTFEYNTAENCGGYSFVNDAQNNDLFQYNVSTNCSEGEELDNTSQCSGVGSVWDHETVNNPVGDGYCIEGFGCPTCLTGGSAAGANYSGNTVSNSTVTGAQSCIYESAPGGAATYTNDTCTGGCVVR